MRWLDVCTELIRTGRGYFIFDGAGRGGDCSAERCLHCLVEIGGKIAHEKEPVEDSDPEGKPKRKSSNPCCGGAVRVLPNPHDDLFNQHLTNNERSTPFNIWTNNEHSTPPRRRRQRIGKPCRNHPTPTTTTPPTNNPTRPHRSMFGGHGRQCIFHL